MAKQTFIEVKLPMEIVDEVDKLIANYEVKKDHKINSREEFVSKAVSKFIENVKSSLPSFQLSQILTALGY